MHACQSFHHAVKSQSLIRPARLAWRDQEKEEERGREREYWAEREGANERVLSFVLITEAEIKTGEEMDGWMETRGQKLGD